MGAGSHHGLLADESDRAAFRSWFTFLADAQFERAADDVDRLRRRSSGTLTAKRCARTLQSGIAATGFR